MVATERIKLAETDEELRSTIEEKEAFKSALQLIENENDRLRHLLEKSDPLSSEENTQKTLISPNSNETKFPNEPEPIDTSRGATSQDSRGSLELPEEDDIETPTDQFGHSEHEATNKGEGGEVVGIPSTPVETIREIPPIHQPSSSTSSPPEIDNPWSTFFQKEPARDAVTFTT